MQQVMLKFHFISAENGRAKMRAKTHLRACNYAGARFDAWWNFGLADEIVQIMLIFLKRISPVSCDWILSGHEDRVTSTTWSWRWRCFANSELIRTLGGGGAVSQFHRPSP